MTGPDEPRDPRDPAERQRPTPGPRPGDPGGDAYGSPPPDYPQGYGPPPGTASPADTPPVAPPGRGLGRLLAGRNVDRAQPRLGTALAGVGVALGLIGVLIWSITYLASGFEVFAPLNAHAHNHNSRRFLGAGLCAAVAVIGYVLVLRWRRGPLASAGVAASALSIPLIIEFVSLDISHLKFGSVDAVVLISVAVWLISYLLVPGAKGHTLYLGLSAYALWIYAIGKTAPNTSNLIRPGLQFTPFGSGSLSSGSLVPGTLGSNGLGSSFSTTNRLGKNGVLNVGNAPAAHTTTLALVSLAIGVVYYLLAFLLDRSGNRAPGVAFVLTGLPAVAVGIAALSPHLKQVGSAILLIVVGLVLAAYGGRYGRRFTTWAWVLGVALGAVLILAKIGSSSGTTVGISLIVIGAVFVVAAWALARALHEPDDVPVPAQAPPA